MHKLFLTLVATVFVSSVAVVSEAAPPVAEGAIPSGYVWLSGGTVAAGIGYSWGHGHFLPVPESSGMIVPVGQWASGSRWRRIGSVEQLSRSPSSHPPIGWLPDRI